MCVCVCIKGCCISSTGEDHVTCHMSHVTYEDILIQKSGNEWISNYVRSMSHICKKRDKETDISGLFGEQSCKVCVFMTRKKRKKSCTTHDLFIKCWSLWFNFHRSYYEASLLAVSFPVYLPRYDCVRFSFLASAVAMRCSNVPSDRSKSFGLHWIFADRGCER